MGYKERFMTGEVERIVRDESGRLWIFRTEPAGQIVVTAIPLLGKRHSGFKTVDRMEAWIIFEELMDLYAGEVINPERRALHDDFLS